MIRSIALVPVIAASLLLGCDPAWTDWGVGERQFGVYEIRQEGEDGPWILLIKQVVRDGEDSVVAEAGPWPGPPPALVEVLPEITPEHPTRDSLRFVLENTEGAGTDRPVCAIRIVHPDGRVLGEYRRPGRCDRADVTEDRGQKLIFVSEIPEQPLAWVLVNFWTGAKLAEATGTMPPNQEVVHVQQLGNHILVVLRFRDASDIRVQLFGPGGQLVHVFDIPGTFQEAVDNGIDIKAITTIADGIVHNDVVNVVTGDRTRVIGVAQNPLRGEHRELQHHRIGGQDRFLETVYDAGRNETTVRILDGAGQLVGTRILPGEFLAAQAQGGRKVFVTQRPPMLDLFVLDLASGSEIRSASHRAVYDPSRPWDLSTPGAAGVPVTVDGSQTLVSVPTG